MTFTLTQLKECAAASGAELIVLPGNGKLSGDMRGKTGKELWLCVPANTDKKLIYAAASRFDKVYMFNKQEER